jgi:hypothetical protein
MASEVFAMIGTIKRLLSLWPLLACALIAASVMVFVIVAALTSSSQSQVTTISDALTPLAAPAAADTPTPSLDSAAESGGADSADTSAVEPAEPTFVEASNPAASSVEILAADRSADIVIPPASWIKPVLVWHEPWEETVWVPFSYWRLAHHVEVYGTREGTGTVCFDGTPLPAGLSAQETADFVSAHGGGYRTGVTSKEVYLLQPAYLERELVQGGTYRLVRHEGYWSYN